jgi:hypothetical protein
MPSDISHSHPTKRHLHPRSLAAQAMGKVDPVTKAVVPPIHVATTYIRDEDNRYSSGFAYGRPDNATTREETVQNLGVPTRLDETDGRPIAQRRHDHAQAFRS